MLHTFIDLFSGIGGMRIAAERNGLLCVFSSEIDSAACKTYKENFGDVPEGDITKIKSSQVPDFDLLMAGFPCQPFSYAGQCKGFDDARGTLVFEVFRILKDKLPSAFLLENVKGIVNHDQGKTLSTILKLLDKCGYKVYWSLLNSSYFGLPQHRERFYCVGIRSDLDHRGFKFPIGTNVKVTLKSIIKKISKNQDLAIPEAWARRIDKHIKSKNQRVEHTDFKNVPGSYRSKFSVFSYLKPDNTLRFHLNDPRKSQIQEGFFTSINSLSPTIIAGRVPKLWDLKRQLSVSECKRLQGFPPNFKFPVPDSQAYKQLGNAVSIPVVMAVIDAIMEHLKSHGMGQETTHAKERQSRATNNLDRSA